MQALPLSTDRVETSQQTSKSTGNITVRVGEKVEGQRSRVGNFSTALCS